MSRNATKIIGWHGFYRKKPKNSITIGGGAGSRTPVRNYLSMNFYTHSLSFNFILVASANRLYRNYSGERFASSIRTFDSAITLCDVLSTPSVSRIEERLRLFTQLKRNYIRHLLFLPSFYVSTENTVCNSKNV